jgi:hypothetical protein
VTQHGRGSHWNMALLAAFYSGPCKATDGGDLVRLW